MKIKDCNITDEFLEKHGLDRVYKDIRNYKEYLVNDGADEVFLVDLTDDSGNNDKWVANPEFEAYFIDYTATFYRHLFRDYEISKRILD